MDKLDCRDYKDQKVIQKVTVPKRLRTSRTTTGVGGIGGAPCPNTSVLHELPFNRGELSLPGNEGSAGYSSSKLWWNRSLCFLVTPISFF